MRSGAKLAIVGGAFLVVASGVGYGGYNLWNGVTGGSPSRNEGEQRQTGPVTSEEVTGTAKDFLAAWASGEPERAAQLTNNPVEAGPALLAYREGAMIASADIVPGSPEGATVPFTVRATVSYEGHTKAWSYVSKLTVVRGLTTGRPLVDWKPTVVHPKLSKGATLRTGDAKAAALAVLGRGGVELTQEKYPSLGPILDELRKRYGTRVGGEPGIETWIDSGSEEVADTTLLTLSEGVKGRLETTIDPAVQTAAEQAVKRYRNASVVAVQPSTGAIRAVANSPAGGNNTAFLGRLAPGSTLKIVTAALLLEKGLVTADGPAECPKSAMYYGRTFQNLDGFELGTVPFRRSFARSCNTAFIKKIDDVHDDAALGKEAREVFGIDKEWKTGIASFDGRIPAEAGGEAAAQYIGQGTVQMNPLTVASITATAKAGAFKQPYLISPGLDDRAVATADRPLNKAVARQLRDMMRDTATSGTAAKAMTSVGGDKGAKTGSAEVDGQTDPNSWFAGFSDDLAAAAVVLSGGHGGDTAGQVVSQVLRRR
ncbi:penicillin-binding transpeptidase domain-containing protein [Streptomyces filamentosus]|uniref:penicillin-binding transpeptidase domain-containing protein n=1 Tax=Streptomyces filamentosus TaxID=67294 RepID=UPI0036E7A3B0